MPTLHIYTPPRVVEQLDKAAAALCLSRKDFIRAILSAAAQHLEKDEHGDINSVADESRRTEGKEVAYAAHS